MNLSWRQSKQISFYPPIWERVSCYSMRSGASVLHLPPTDMSAPPPHTQKAPISRAPDSSLVCSQLLRWLHRPTAMPAHPRAHFQTALTMAYTTPSNTASVKSQNPQLGTFAAKH